MQQVEGVVGQFDIHPQLRVLGHEAGHQRHDKTFAIRHRTGHAQQPLGLAVEVAHGPQRFFTAVLQALAMLQKGLPGLAQGDAAGAAIQQPSLQALFEACDLPADMRGRHAEAFGGGGELPGFGHGDELVDPFPAAGH